MRAFSLVEATENAGVGCVGGSQRRSKDGKRAFRHVFRLTGVWNLR